MEDTVMCLIFVVVFYEKWCNVSWLTILYPTCTNSEVYLTPTFF